MVKPMKTTWNDRFRQSMEEEGITPSDLMKACGVTAGTITGWKKGGIKRIDGLNLVNAAQVLKRTPEWLMTGEGEKRLGKESAAFAATVAWIHRNASEDGRKLLDMAIEAVKSSVSHPKQGTDR